jgi:protein ImuA
LRVQIHRLEQDCQTGHGAAIPLGIPAIDRHLPQGGLVSGSLHEIMPASPADSGAATGFCATLLARFLDARPGEAEPGMALWCLNPASADAGEIYPPGLAQIALDPSRLLTIRLARDKDVLWAMEEALRSGGATVVLGEVTSVSLTESRRLQLAAGKSGANALLLRPPDRSPGPSAAVTRWRITATPGAQDGWAALLEEPGRMCWRADLFRCRGGAPGNWLMEWCDEKDNFALATPVLDRSAEPRRTSLAG